jgi:HSP20 family protein
MKLIRSNPSNLTRFSDFDDWFRNPFAAMPSLGRVFDSDFFGGVSEGRLAVDVHEDDDHFYARFEMPGLKKEDVKVELHDGMLTVSGEKKSKTDEGESSYTLSRSVSVPDGVREDAIAAKLEDGILTLTLPKPENRKPKVISVD